MNMPSQVSGGGPAHRSAEPASCGTFDPREHLSPRRMTMAMWDQAFLLRHVPGESFADWDRVLDETIERGYNTVRLDPMPQWLDLIAPDTILHWPDPCLPHLPWCWKTAVDAPVGRWLVDFMEKLLARPEINYTLSAWWFCNQPGHAHPGPAVNHPLRTHSDAADLWAAMLREWKSRFGFDRLVYVDLANEVPYFFPGFRERLKAETGCDWDAGPLSQDAASFTAAELNTALARLRQEFPELRFTASIHGDTRWLEIPVELDCLDVHFYADADPRWSERTRFREFMPQLYTSTGWHAEFSARCTATHKAIAPMLRQRQRAKLAAFASWAAGRGMPLTTSESWSCWYYIDSPGLDWGWLLDWAEWSVDDALEFGMWGWTPHNYLQPQFANWRDVRWHQRLTDRFLRG